MKTFLLSAILFIISSSSFSQTTSLDLTFGDNGIVTTQAGIESSAIRGMAVQADGKIVVAGRSSYDGYSSFAIARYNTNGSLDTTFNDSGKIVTSFGSQSEAFTVAIQPDGKILAAGYTYNDTAWQFGIIRYTTNGTPDSSFGENGMVSTAIGYVDDEINSLAIQSDGKIIAVGYSNAAMDMNEYIPQVTIVRYNTDGSLDDTFSDDGKQTLSLGSFDVAFSAAIQTNGKIVVGGTHVNEESYYQFLLLRYNTDGNLDTTFNGDGKILATIDSSYDVIRSMALQDDGKIVVAGTSVIGFNYDNYNFALARYNTDGTIDSTFGNSGKVVTLLGSYQDMYPSIALKEDGKIIVAGDVNLDGSSYNLALAQYNNNGSADSTFDDDGKIITDITGYDNINAVKTNGSRIYVGGASDQFLLVAYQTNELSRSSLSLSAELKNNDETNLEWKTTGKNFPLYRVQRSKDGKKFTDIGKLVSSKSNASQNNYLFTDASPLPGDNFYRLKMTGADNNFTYSKIVVVTVEVAFNKSSENNITLKIFPNPATDILQLRIPSSQKENIIIQITDAVGKIAKRATLTSSGAAISTAIDVSSLRKGTYFLSINTASGNLVQKFIKQ